MASLAVSLAMLFALMVTRELTILAGLQPALKSDLETLSAARDSQADVVLPSLGDIP